MRLEVKPMIHIKSVWLQFHRVYCYLSMEDMSADEERERTVMGNMGDAIGQWQEVALMPRGLSAIRS